MPHFDAVFAPGVMFDGRYEIVAKLGEGGFGTVHKARQLSTGQLVALKILRLAEHGGPTRTTARVARFLREARVCAQLRHPNIVQLVDSGQMPDGTLYIAFSFAPGDNLATVLEAEGALSPREARYLMMQVLDALACAHAEGVIHRDLKPSNIMVIPTGARRNAVVLDFGIGAILDDDPAPRLTGSHDALGTPGYGAPEQWRSVEPSPAADLFSWGLVFLECLTGAPVYTGTAAEIFYRLLAPEPVPMLAALERHPLGELIARAVRKDAAARDVTARGLLDALDACDLRGLTRDTVVGTAGNARAKASVVTAIAPTVRRTTASPAIEAERRQLTALCGRIAVSQDPSSSAPPGDAVDDALRSAISLCIDTARRHGGTIAAVLGDELLIYFGYPRATEADARQAARAAHAIAAAIDAENKRAQGLCFEVRLGLHTGPVVGAELGSLDDVRLVSGATPRLAARLAALAAPGQTVVSVDAQPVLRAAFDLASEEPRAIDGILAPVETFRLGPERAEPVRNTLDSAKTQISGRDSELALLLERWRRTCDGSGQSSLVTGEPGIGKSRLARELRARVAGEAHRFLEMRCSPDTQNSALAPMIDLLERAIGLDLEPEASQKIARLDAELVRHRLVPAEAMPLFLPLFALPTEAPYAPLDVSPQRHKTLTLEAISALLFAMADKRPVLLSAEDLHWADPTTIELLTQLVRSAPEGPMCIVMTARPEFSPTFSTAGILLLPLGRLGRPQIEQMVAALTGDKPVPAAVIDHITDRADGVPLFVEELLRMMGDAGLLVERVDRYELTGPITGAVIPGTLRALLTARLDRLGQAKETAQLAAALGREFHLDLLSAASPRGAAAVANDLERLMHAGLVLRKRRSKDAIGVFKHALVRDAAYESLPSGARHLAHARIATALEQGFPEVVRTRPDLLAHHHAEADQRPQAVGYAQRAAEQGLQRSAYVETIAHASHAASWADALPGAEAVEAQLTANGTLIQALMATRGWGDPQVKAAAERSASLLAQLGPESKHRVPTLWFLFVYHHVASNRATARGIAEELVAIAEHSGDRGLCSAAIALHGLALFHDGDHAGGRRACERAVELYDPALHRDHGPKFGTDSLVLAQAYVAQIRWLSGDTAAALQLADSAVAWAREVGHVPSLGLGLMYACIVNQWEGNRKAVAAMASEILSLSAKYGLPAYEGYAAVLFDWANGEVERSRAVVEGLANIGCKLALTYYASLAPDNQCARGELDAAIEGIDHCLALCRDNDEHFFEAELHRRRALYQARRDPASDSVRRSLEQAAALAERCDMPRIEALATLELIQRFGGTAEQRARIDQLLNHHPALQEIMQTPRAGESQ